MTGMLLASDPEVREGQPAARPRGPRRLPAHWPLTLTLLGFPLWWALGLHSVLPILITAVMLDQLVRRRRIALPTGFVAWALLLVWVAMGVFLLWADAPGAVPGGGPTRLLVFLYRASWYAAATVLLLWVANLRERELSSRWVHQLLGYMFVVTTVGGLAGLLWPTFEFRSVLELALPGGLSQNALVQAIVHPGLADIQSVLGRETPRPKAPFAYANSWGSNLALFLPFFVVAWIRNGARWQRTAAPFVLTAALLPTAFSLNRGLWACLVIGVVGLVVLQLRKGRLGPLLAAAAALVCAAVLLAASPLGTLVQERLDNQHSNERRSQLLSQTFWSTVEGSPVFGFGSTRDVQGSFASIAGGSAADCSACGVPPLGTQGHLWMVLFSQGLVGAVMFSAFFAIALWRTWRCRTLNETLCTFVLVFFALQVLIYDTLGMPLFTVMIAIALVAREQWSRPGAIPQLLHDATRRLRETAPVLVSFTVLGAVAGMAVATQDPTFHYTRVSILLSQPPVYISTADLGDDSALPGDVTIDTEAALTVSRRSLSRVLGTTDPQRLKTLRERIRVTAPENTRVLTIEVRGTTADRSQFLATSVAGSYLLTRRDYLSARRDQSLAILRQRLADLSQSTAVGVRSPSVEASRARIEEALTTTLFTPTSAGEVIRTSPARTVRRQPEVRTVTGAGIGLLLGAALVVALPGWRPWPLPFRRKTS